MFVLGVKLRGHLRAPFISSECLSCFLKVLNQQFLSCGLRASGIRTVYLECSSHLPRKSLLLELTEIFFFVVAGFLQLEQQLRVAYSMRAAKTNKKHTVTKRSMAVTQDTRGSEFLAMVLSVVMVSTVVMPAGAGPSVSAATRDHPPRLTCEGPRPHTA